jgi:hypothetical protein
MDGRYEMSIQLFLEKCEGKRQTKPRKIKLEGNATSVGD